MQRFSPTHAMHGSGPGPGPRRAHKAFETFTIGDIYSSSSSGTKQFYPSLVLIPPCTCPVLSCSFKTLTMAIHPNIFFLRHLTLSLRLVYLTPFRIPTILWHWNNDFCHHLPTRLQIMARYVQWGNCSLLKLDQVEVHTDRSTHTKEDLVLGAGEVHAVPCHACSS